MKICLSCRYRFEADGWRCPKCGEEPPVRNGVICFAPELDARDGDFPPESFSRLAELEEGHFWFRNRNRLIVWALKRYAPDASRFLEIGCGTGHVLRAVWRARPDLQVCGADLHTSGLVIAQQRLSETTLYQLDARRIPFEGEFDVVGAFDVIEHVDEDDVVLGQMYRALSPGGVLMLTLPQHPFLWSHVDEYSRHKRRYTRTELRAKVEEAHFHVVFLTSFISILFPLMLLRRMTRHGSEQETDPGRELRIHGYLNAFFKGCVAVERFLIRRGVSLPFGGSLFLVGRKPGVRSRGNL